MPNISNYKNHESPLLRAAYWLAMLSFEDSSNFEVLQSLSKECEEAFQQSFAADVATCSCPTFIPCHIEGKLVCADCKKPRRR